MPLPIDLLDSLRRDVLALFLADDASLSTLTLMATGRRRPNNVPLLLSSYNYYAVLILARFPPRELGMVDGGTTTTTPAVPPLLSATSAFNQTKA